MEIALGLLAGLALAALSILQTRRGSAKLRPDPEAARQLEITSWAVYLGLAALIYIGFALREAGREWMSIELAGLVAYTALAWIGARGRVRVLALGWLLHAGWDVFVHAGVSGAFVPAWYRWACLSFDVLAAVYLARRARA